MQARFLAVLTAASIPALLVQPAPADAAPVTITQPFFQLDNVAANSVGAAVGLRLRLGANEVLPNGLAVPPTTGIATTTNTLTGAPVSRVINFSPSTVSPDFYIRTLADDPGLRGPWTLTFTNGADSSSVSVSLPPAAQHIGAVQSVSVSGSTFNPTFTWSAPASGQINGYRVNLVDRSRPVVGGGFDNVLSRNLTGTSFTVPTALAGGLALDPTHAYTIEINAFSTRDNASSNLGNPNVFARSRSFFDFRPIVGGPPEVFLGFATGGGAFGFSIPVIGGNQYFIDPEIAIGYDYEIGAGDPNFRSVTLPTGIGDDLYDLFSIDGLGVATLLAEDLAGGVEFDFGPAGLGRFRVLGIEIAAGLDPDDPTAFVTGLRFTRDGMFTGTMTPIRLDVPDASPVSGPGTALLLAVPLATLLRRRAFRTCGT